MRALKLSISHGRKRDCYCPKLDTQLLCVSRATYNEAFPVLYGENKFVIRCSAHTHGDLGSLLEMSSRYLAEITTLLLRLNTWPCFRGDDDINDLNPPKCYLCLSSPDIADPAWASPQVAVIGERQQIILEQWRQLCRRLASALTPGKVWLTFVCDVDDLPTGELVIKPLLELPRLRQCSIRLGRRKDQYELATLARETSVTMTQQHRDGVPRQPSTPFLFADLPQELRLHILEYTDLNSCLPMRKHMSSPHGSGLLPSILRMESGKLVHGDPWQIRNKICCWKCTPSFRDCCCPNVHASYASGCVCRVIPMELFRVSRQMYDDATQVFYTKSKFWLEQGHDETLAFLQHLPTIALGFIREFTIKLPFPHFEEWDLKEKRHDQQFKRLVKYIRDTMDLSRLHITLNFIDVVGDIEGNDEETNRHIVEVYLDVANTLCMLSSLKGLELEIYYGMDGMKLWLTREIFGERYYSMGLPEIVPPTEKEKADEYEYPPWHRFDVRLPDSNFTPRKE